MKYWFKRRENFFKKKFQKVWQIRKEVLLLHPQSEMIARIKKRRHVHRHIELTANIRESNTFSSRFEKQPSILSTILKYTMKSLILAQDER